MTDPFVHVESVEKRWNGQLGVEDISLSIPRGSFVALLGPSGCGKSTTLRLLAGLETPDSGRIIIGGRDVTASPAAERGLSMVFQSYALFPHLDVAENVLFGLKVRRVPRAEQRAKLVQALDMTGLTGLEQRKPGQISGGQRQRIGLARALYGNPKVIVLDEPNSNLDDQGEQALALTLQQLHQEGTTVFVVSHRPSLLRNVDKLLVLKDGQIKDLGARDDVMRRLAQQNASQAPATR